MLLLSLGCGCRRGGGRAGGGGGGGGSRMIRLDHFECNLIAILICLNKLVAVHIASRRRRVGGSVG